MTMTSGYGFPNVTETPTPSCTPPPVPSCEDTCEFYLCESIPDGMNLDEPNNSTTKCWLDLLNIAKSNVKIGSYYWSLLLKDSELPANFSDPRNSGQDGQDIYDGIVATAKRGIRVDIAQNFDTSTSMTWEATDMEKLSSNIRPFFGIIHTKSWVVDSRHFYVGSANFDWRSLRQVKELGILGLNCPCIAQDVEKIEDTYWDLGLPDAKIPSSWPESRWVGARHGNPYVVPQLGATNLDVYVSSSPPEFNACGRENDIDAMVKVIDEATEFVHLAVMDYIPATLYLKENYYFSALDDAIRRAAFRRVKVKFMMSKWSHTAFEYFGYLHSLATLNGSLPCTWQVMYETCKPGTQGEVEVRIFEIPPDGPITDKIYARVQHNKYFVTESTAYIGTSNWSADYWITTAGIGVIVRSDNIQGTAPIVSQTQDVFMRDWNSEYATDISHFDNRGNRIDPTAKYGV
ncbi:unnamed protein product, partial [Mesorhabditis spiculigera]